MSQLTNEISSALFAGDAATVTRLLEGHCADDLMPFPNVPLLVHACDVPKLPLPCLEAVLQHVRDVNVADYLGQTGLMTAAAAENVELVRRMLSAGAKIEPCDQQGRTVLHLAVLPLQPNPELLRMLIEAGANVASTNHSGETPLHLAARIGHLPAIRFLLERGAPVNATAKSGRTPLHYAAEGGRAEVCRLLLQSGATLDARDAETWTPFLVAVAAWAYPAARVLVESGANVNARLKAEVYQAGGATAIVLALGCFDGWLRDERASKRTFDRDFFKTLVRAGADLNVRLPDGKTLGLLAYDDDEALEFLLEQGLAD